MGTCADHDDCDNDKSAWSRLGYESMKHKKVIGIAKFGHVMYGPYKDSGETWGTDDVDACNGVWSDNDYFYVGTAWHPYLVGCQGPADHPQDHGRFAQCSANGMDKYVSEAMSTASTGSAALQLLLGPSAGRRNLLKRAGKLMS